MDNSEEKKSNRLINRETILYTLFGVLTSIENVVLFKILLVFIENYKMVNIITLIVVKLTAYICNKNFVFKSKTNNLYGLAAEIGRFLLARGASMLLDYFGLILMVEVMSLNILFSKFFITILVVILNYFIGKKHVFKKTEL